VIVPLEEQRNTLTKKWGDPNLELFVEVASPYEDSDIKGAGQRLKSQGAELIVLDCMGYSETQNHPANISLYHIFPQ
jgi:protein AroM